MQAYYSVFSTAPVTVEGIMAENAGVKAQTLEWGDPLVWSQS